MLSVIIPVYNVEKYLTECVDSILCQTETDLEIILVDDGSTDKSSKLCDEYAQRDARVRVIHRENGGLSAARNTGLGAASGEFVYFLDSDDYIVQDALKTLKQTAEREQADYVFFDGLVFFDGCEEDDSVSRYVRSKQYSTAFGKTQLFELLNSGEYRTAVPLMFFRREYLIKNNLRFLEGIIHEDELFTFLVYNADGRSAHCHEQLYARRVRPSSIMTSSGAARRYDSMLKIYDVLSEMYRTGEAVGVAADMYLVRCAKSVLGKYALMSDADRISEKIRHTRFKRDVMSHGGFGDMKLKIKCSGKLGNLFYRAQNKLAHILGR